MDETCYLSRTWFARFIFTLTFFVLIFLNNVELKRLFNLRISQLIENEAATVLIDLLFVDNLTYLGKVEIHKYVHKNCWREQLLTRRSIYFAFRASKQVRRAIWFHQTFQDRPFSGCCFHLINNEQHGVLYTTLSVPLKGWTHLHASLMNDLKISCNLQQGRHNIY